MKEQILYHFRTNHAKSLKRTELMTKSLYHLLSKETIIGGILLVIGS